MKEKLKLLPAYVSVIMGTTKNAGVHHQVLRTVAGLSLSFNNNLLENLMVIFNQFQAFLVLMLLLLPACKEKENCNYEYSLKKTGEKVFQLDLPVTVNHTGCRCGEVLRGVISPVECSLFRDVCNPEQPLGPCMVSSEGTCAAYYNYHIG